MGDPVGNLVIVFGLLFLGISWGVLLFIVVSTVMASRNRPLKYPLPMVFIFTVIGIILMCIFLWYLDSIKSFLAPFIH